MRLLVAVDGSSHARHAVELAARLACELRAAEIVLVNVGHIPFLAVAEPAARAPLEEEVERAGQQILDEAATMLAGLKVPVIRMYRRGNPPHEIILAASESTADLILVGARGLGRLGGLILGSVSERVLHEARIPVVVVR